MKPTISTSPLMWSCTTAGINPSSFVKSISLTGGVRLLADDDFPVQQKTPPLLPAGSAFAFLSGSGFECPLRAQSCRPATVAVMMVDVHVGEDPNHWSLKPIRWPSPWQS